MATVLALAAALAYGTADFLGGAVSRRSTALRTLTWCVPIGLVVSLVAAVALGGRFTWTSIAWGWGAGIAGGIGLITFYRALARGPMSVVAPVSALAAAVLPVGAGVLGGERLDATVLIGVLLCLVAIALVSMESGDSGADAAGGGETPPANGSPGVPPDGAPAGSSGGTSHGSAGVVPENSVDGPLGGASGGPLDEAPRKAPARSGRSALSGLSALSARSADSGPLMAMVSGACFGVFFILLKEAGDAGGLWPLVAARLGTMVVVGAALAAVARARGGDIGPPVAGRLLIGLALLSGILDASANVLYFVAAQQGMLSLAAVLTSLYPAITVLLARIAYSERLRAVQRLGLVIAAAGVTLVTIG